MSCSTDWHSDSSYRQRARARGWPGQRFPARACVHACRSITPPSLDHFDRHQQKPGETNELAGRFSSWIDSVTLSLVRSSPSLHVPCCITVGVALWLTNQPVFLRPRSAGYTTLTVTRLESMGSKSCGGDLEAGKAIEGPGE